MPNKLSRFWQELKRRNVIRVITVYTGAAFVILSLVDMIREPFELPNWSFKLVLVLLSVGLIIAVILSWIYDIHPEGGMIKTEPADKIKPVKHPGSSKGWKIATYMSVVIIIGLIALNIFGGKKGPRIDESVEKSIAVLIFGNYSGDPGQDVMCEGLTDEIITNLFKIASFDDVRSLNSVKQFQDSVLGTKEIAQKLHVNYVLAGSSKKIGDELKITAQLIEAKSDKYIWSQDYKIAYSEIMGIPGEIALQIAYNLKAFISKDVRKSIDRNSTDNLEAYEIMKQIVSLYNIALKQSDPTNFNKIKELANNAIALDPDYADAYAFLGNMKLFEGLYFGDKEIQSVAWDAKRYYNQAIDLDAYNLMANCGLALISYWVEWDYIKLYDFGLKFPDFLYSDVSYISGYTMFKTAMGNFKEAVSIPDTNYYSENVVRAYILLGNEERARVLLSRAAVEQRNYTEVGEAFIWLQEYDTALYYLQSALTSGLPLINIPRYQADLALACYKTNHNERARKIIGALKERSDTTSAGSPSYFIGWYYGWIGEPDSAFYWLEKAVKNRSVEIPWLKVDPAFKSLKEDPRYTDLYERTGHKAYDDYMARQNR